MMHGSVVRTRRRIVGVWCLFALIVGCADTDDEQDGPVEVGRSADEPYPASGETVKVKLTIEEDVRWEVGPGAIYDALAYDGQIPGPTIEAEAGDHLVIELTNNTKEPHSIHTHIVDFIYDNDGVDPPSLVPPGKTRTIEWDLSYAGTFPYHDHGDEAGVARGLFGALVVHAPEEKKAVEQLVVLADFDQTKYVQLPGVADRETGEFPDAGTYRGGHQYMHTINGRAYEDAIPAFLADVGDRVRWRVVSIGTEFHTWHIHGHRWLEGGTLTDNILLGPGMYSTFEFVEDKAGEWLVHCHVPDHMEGGMMARYVVDP